MGGRVEYNTVQRIDLAWYRTSDSDRGCTVPYDNSTKSMRRRMRKCMRKWRRECARKWMRKCEMSWVGKCVGKWLRKKRQGTTTTTLAAWSHLTKVHHSSWCDSSHTSSFTQGTWQNTSAASWLNFPCTAMSRESLLLLCQTHGYNLCQASKLLSG